MSMNYALGFSLFLILLVGLNIYFFYTLNGVGKVTNKVIAPPIKYDVASSSHREINEYLNYLPSQYRYKHSKYLPIQRKLMKSFNTSIYDDSKSVWREAEIWASDISLFPDVNGARGRILHAIQKSPIAIVDNAKKGTQLKLLLVLEGKQRLFFKPKRYELDYVIHGNIYGGFDRHNSEVFAYYLAMVLDFKWIAPSVFRKIHIAHEIMPFATSGLKKTMIKSNETLCIYGECYYCKPNEFVCPDKKGYIEGAAILYYNKPFKVLKSPWRRSYTTKKMDWQKNNNYCKTILQNVSRRRLLNLIDVSIFDFLIQNGDRHHYEVYKDKIVLLDNGKGLGNPKVDELDILAPLYQCCMLSSATWQHLETLAGGSLTETIKLISSFHNNKLATNEHFAAVERRLLTVYATVQYCIGKHGSAKVFKNNFME